MRTQKLRLAGWGTTLLLVLLAPAGSRAQSSANFKLSPGVRASGGNSSSTNFKLMDIMGGGRARSSSASFDVIGGLAVATYSSVATVTVNSPGSPGFASFAFPVNATDNTVAGVLSELGAYKKTDWRLGHWSAADSAYMEPGEPLDLTTFDRTQGYWLITKSAGAVTDVGLPAPVGACRIPLLSKTAGYGGWNQIGNPFLFPVNVSALQVTDGTTTFSLTSVSNTFTETVVKAWSSDSSTYVNATVLNGRTAYWVRKKDGVSAAITLIVPYQASAAGSAVPALAKPEGADWAVAITARQGDRTCEPMMVGATAAAMGPQNSLNFSRAPSPPGGTFLSLYVPKGGSGDDYVSDFQPRSDHMSWDFVAAGGDVPGEMTIQVAAFDLPTGTKLSLTDIAAGTTRAVTPGEVVTMAATAAPRTLRLEAVAAGAVGPTPTNLTDALRYAYPNPFAAGTGLAFTLSRGGDIRVGIYDVAGRQVRQLERLAQGPGEYVLVWDGRDAGGHSVASGVYLARYRAGSADGVRRLIRVE